MPNIIWKAFRKQCDGSEGDVEVESEREHKMNRFKKS